MSTTKTDRSYDVGMALLLLGNTLVLTTYFHDLGLSWLGAALVSIPLPIGLAFWVWGR